MKKVTINIFLMAVTYVVPLYIFHQYQNDYHNVDLRQNLVYLTMLTGAAILTYLNHKNRKQAVSQKWIWTIFEIIGILGILYAGGILLILFSFRHGIGF